MCFQLVTVHMNYIFYKLSINLYTSQSYFVEDAVCLWNFYREDSVVGREIENIGFVLFSKTDLIQACIKSRAFFSISSINKSLLNLMISIVVYEEKYWETRTETRHGYLSP